MKKIICLILLAALFCSAAYAESVPALSDNLFSCAKQAFSCLASGEYERLVTQLPFSDVSPSASEWQSFSGNYSDLTNVQTKYAVAYWTGSNWNIAVPAQEPSNGSVEVLVLISDDGNTFSGYRYATWSRVESDYSGSTHVRWNKEYAGGTPVIFAD
jgi:hypothetical protein